MKFSLKTLASTIIFTLTSHALAAPDAQTQAFLDKLNSSGGKPMEQMTPTDARAVLTDAQKSVKVDMSGVTVQEKKIEVDGKPLSLTIVRPAGVSKPLPVFMFFHGGGWVIGDYPTHARFIRDLVVDSGAVAVYVDYSRSPEAHYPVAINQAYAATKWVAEHGKEINVDSKRLAIVGNSVGGNMTAVVALMAKEKGTPAIKLQVLFWPVTDANFETDSYNQFAQGYFLTKNMMKWFWDSYAPDQKVREDILASPLKASAEQLKGLPPALIITAGNDVLRDEGKAYAAKLDAAHVPVISVSYNGSIHDFGLLNALSQNPETKAAILEAGTELKQALK